MKTFIALTLTLFFCTQALADGQELHGGHTVNVDQRPVLKDLIGRATCRWVRGIHQLPQLTYYPTFYQATSEVHWYLAMQLTNEIIGLKICFTQEDLVELPRHEQQGITIFKYKTKQTAIRVNNEVYVDEKIYQEMEERQQTFLFVHEASHALIKVDNPTRLTKLNTLVNRLNVNLTKRLSKAELADEIEMNEVQGIPFAVGDLGELKADMEKALLINQNRGDRMAAAQRLMPKIPGHHPAYPVLRGLMNSLCASMLEAYQNQNKESIEQFLSWGLNGQFCRPEEMNQMLSASIKARRPDLTKLLVPLHGIDPSLQVHLDLPLVGEERKHILRTTAFASAYILEQEELIQAWEERADINPGNNLVKEMWEPHAIEEVNLFDWLLEHQRKEDALRLLHSGHFDPNSKAFISALKRGNIEIAEAFMSMPGLDLNRYYTASLRKYGYDGSLEHRTPLLHAMYSGNQTLVRRLLQNERVDPNLSGKNSDGRRSTGDFPLIHAIRNANTEQLKMILDHPLTTADRVSAISLLDELAGGKPTPAFFHALRTCKSEIIETMMNHPKVQLDQLNQRVAYDMTPLVAAINMKDLELFKKMLKNPHLRADINSPSATFKCGVGAMEEVFYIPTREIPLMHILRIENSELRFKMLEAIQSDEKGMTNLDRARNKDYFELFMTKFYKTQDWLDLKDEYRKKELLLMTSWPQVNRNFYKTSSDTYVTFFDGTEYFDVRSPTPLMCAVLTGDPQLVSKITSLPGIDFTITNDDRNQETATDLAEEYADKSTRHKKVYEIMKARD